MDYTAVTRQNALVYDRHPDAIHFVCPRSVAADCGRRSAERRTRRVLLGLEIYGIQGTIGRLYIQRQILQIYSFIVGLRGLCENFFAGRLVDTTDVPARGHGIMPRPSKVIRGPGVAHVLNPACFLLSFELADRLGMKAQPTPC